MGQKINPIGFRLGINRTWDSRWYANTVEDSKLLHEEIKIREYIEKELKQAEFCRSELDFRLAPHDPTRRQVEAQVTDLNGRRRTKAGTTTDRLQARHQFGEGKRFDEVIVGAGA